MDKTAANPAAQHEAVKDHFMHYFRQQRRKAIPVLAGIIRDPGQPAPVRHHAVETLGHIVGRKLHKEGDPLASAEHWLSKRGH